MAEAEQPQDAVPKKKSKLPLILGGVLFLVLGGGGFYAVYAGLILAPAAEHASAEHASDMPDIAFVPLEPVTITLGEVEASIHLRFAAQLEVENARKDEVTLLMPRILDVLNGYLRAVEVAELGDPHALVRLRSQMLRRIQIVTGEGRVRDLLVTEFVLN
ncbi:MAG: flagellar basal body-associated FliL family protein [Candidatus Saccharibacteria bacterium]|nr:flagellar basal body-associated FliL family protein [Pseudorhodobacter sp.]